MDRWGQRTGWTIDRRYPACFENQGTGRVAPSVPTELGYDTHAQRLLSVAAGLKNESLVEAVVRTYPARSHICTTNSAGLRVSFPNKGVHSGPPGGAVTKRMIKKIFIVCVLMF